MEQCCKRKEIKVKWQMNCDCIQESRAYQKGEENRTENNECRPAWEAAGTPAAGSVNWLSYLENWNYLLSCTYETPGSSNFTLRNVPNRNAYMRPPTCWSVLACL